jgi:hypothetical protein
MKGNAIVIGLVIVVAVLIGIVAYPHFTKQASAATPTVQPQPGWMPPTPEFLTLVDRTRAMSDDFSHHCETARIDSLSIQEENLCLDTLFKKVQSNIPAGFSYNVNARYFIPAERSAPQDPSLGAAAKAPTQKAVGPGSAVVNGNGNKVSTTPARPAPPAAENSPN